MTINFDSIPDEMKALPNWVNWKFENRDGRKTKIPYNPRNGERAKANDPTTWATYEEAAQSLDRYDGIGFQLGNSPFVGLDLDHVVKDGKACPQAQEIVQQFDTYTEISPSGSGLHLLVRADIVGKGYRNDLLEVYSQGRYFTVTGNAYQGYTRIAERTNAVRALIQSIEAERNGPEGQAASQPPTEGQAAPPLPATKEKDPAIIIERIRHSQQAELFSRLFDNGDISAYESPSSADQALMNILPFWTGGDIPFMIEIFSLSALAQRGKWQSRPDYRMRTAQAAIASWNGLVYDPAAQKVQRLEQDRFIRECGITTPVDTLKQLVNLDLNDTGNAERLELVYGTMLRYCTASGRWLVWDGTRWKECEAKDAPELYNYVTAVMRLSSLFYNDVRGVPTDKEATARKQAFMKFCSRSQDRNKIADTIGRARGLLPIAMQELNANPWMLNCQNGTINLKTGQLLPHNRANFITQVCAASYAPGARSELWETTVQQIIPDPDVREYVQRFIGYCLTGLTREEKFLFVYGAGGGGKGTFVETVGKVLGDYADTIPVDVLLSARNDAGSGNEPSPQIAKLAGKRLVLTSESAAGRKFNDARLKLMTGGDKLTARFLGREPFTYDPTFKIVLSSNYLPAITNATDKGIRRRLIIVPFTAQLDDVRDITLKERLLQPQEKNAILSWCVDGCLKWQQEGLGDMPLPVKRMLSDYYDENDIVGEFLRQYCDVGDGLHVKGRSLLNAFNTAMDVGAGWHGLKWSTFRDDMRNRGFSTHKKKDGLYFMGIGFKEGACICMSNA